METSLARIAEIVGGEVVGDGSRTIGAAAPFETAGADDITYAGTPEFLKAIGQTGAGAVIVPRGFQPTDEGLVLVAVDNPEAAFARILGHFNPPEVPVEGISPAAHVGMQCSVGKGASIGPLVAVGDQVTIGARTVLHPGVVIGNRVTIGEDTTLYPNVTIREDSRIGDRVIINAGTVIGSDGYGFAQDGRKHIKIPHLGYVQIDDDVEIGAVNTIDRARHDRTWIQRGTKTDNLVHIGHNVTVGEDTLIVSQVGISGSVAIGKNVIIAGQAGVNPHLTIGDNVQIGPRGKIYSSVEPNQVISGEQMPHRLWLRVRAVLPRLPELRKKISMLEKKLDQVMEKLSSKSGDSGG